MMEICVSALARVCNSHVKMIIARGLWEYGPFLLNSVWSIIMRKRCVLIIFRHMCWKQFVLSLRSFSEKKGVLES